jgi:hypothetical protein
MTGSPVTLGKMLTDAKIFPAKIFGGQALKVSFRWE